MTTISGPFHRLELADGEEITLRPGLSELGEAIRPPWQLFATEPVPVLRIWTAPLKAIGRGEYVDVSSRRLIAVLAPLLEEVAGAGVRVRIRAAGAPPRTEYTVDVLPG